MSAPRRATMNARFSLTRWMAALTATAAILAVSNASAESAGASVEATAPAETSPPAYSPPAQDTIPRQLLFGDTHLHTRLSQDAYSFGVTLDSNDAYRFAKGETLVATHGQKARLDRPLDFLVIATIPW